MARGSRDTAGNTVYWQESARDRSYRVSATAATIFVVESAATPESNSHPPRSRRSPVRVPHSRREIYDPPGNGVTDDASNMASGSVHTERVFGSKNICGQETNEAHPQLYGYHLIFMRNKYVEFSKNT